MEVPLLIKSGFINATANCNNVTTNSNMNYSTNPSSNSNSISKYGGPGGI